LRRARIRKKSGKGKIILISSEKSLLERENGAAACPKKGTDKERDGGTAIQDLCW